jgi:hypothetical protein
VQRTGHVSHSLCALPSCRRAYGRIGVSVGQRLTTFTLHEDARHTGIGVSIGQHCSQPLTPLKLPAQAPSASLAYGWVINTAWYSLPPPIAALPVNMGIDESSLLSVAALTAPLKRSAYRHIGISRHIGHQRRSPASLRLETLGIPAYQHIGISVGVNTVWPLHFTTGSSAYPAYDISMSHQLALSSLSAL